MIRPLDARSASGVVSKHMKLAGIPAKRRAFHALRRTFGTRLLQNEVSFELIQQLLGHRDMDSSAAVVALSVAVRVDVVCIFLAGISTSRARFRALVLRIVRSCPRTIRIAVVGIVIG